jgi:hypothetical protein
MAGYAGLNRSLLVRKGDFCACVETRKRDSSGMINDWLLAEAHYWRNLAVRASSGGGTAHHPIEPVRVVAAHGSSAPHSGPWLWAPAAVGSIADIVLTLRKSVRHQTSPLRL